MGRLKGARVRPTLRAPDEDPERSRIAEAIGDARDQILGLSRKIHASPEIAFEEHKASEWVADMLRRYGYEVELPAGRLPTAIRARMRGGRGAAGPKIAVLAEYDALPELGHGCGHNIMAAGGVAAAVGLAAVAHAIDGEIVFLGAPAEEYGSGKQFMIEDGLFEGIDAALLFHPSDRTTLETPLLALEDVEVEFRGVAAHASGNPWQGKNALDALVILFTSIGLWRQQLRQDARVHGIVVEGGTAPNIIPDHARGRFMIRSADEGYFDALRARFQELVRAAALAAGCEGSATFSGRSRTMRHNETLARIFEANLAALGTEVAPVDRSNLMSSDMGNVSWVVPAIHPSIAICREGTPLHSVAFREAAATTEADQVTLIAAIAVAQTAFDLFADPRGVEDARAEWLVGSERRAALRA
jgi:amidohydrolase